MNSGPSGTPDTRAASLRQLSIRSRRLLGSLLSSLRIVGWEDVIIAANVLAWPTAFYAMNRWLAGFAYLVPPAPWTFVASSGSV